MNSINYKIRLDKIISPFYLFGLSYAGAIILYLFKWSDLYPDLSPGLIIFLLITVVTLALITYLTRHYISRYAKIVDISDSLSTYIFTFIIILGIIDISYEGYIPILKEDFNYREFGMPIIDFLFYSLSIYFSVHFFYCYLISKKIKLLVFAIIITLFQLIILRRYSLVLIILTNIFIAILVKKEFRARIIFIFIFLFFLGSFLFGYYGKLRSRYESENVLNEFKASREYQDTYLGAEVYMTYLYITSPLANLQLNIKKDNESLNHNNLNSFVFYSFIPINITSRVDKIIDLDSPEIELINNNLIVGTYFLTGFHFFGWKGMILLNLFLIAYVFIFLSLYRKNSGYYFTSYAFLSTAATLLIFDNLLIKPDIIFILFIYPLFFSFFEHQIKKK